MGRDNPECSYYRWDILQTCQDLHSSFTGCSEPGDPEEDAARLEWLRMRLADWHDSAGCRWEEFDAAVRRVVEVTLAEAQVELVDRLRSGWRGYTVSGVTRALGAAAVEAALRGKP